MSILLKWAGASQHNGFHRLKTKYEENKINNNVVIPIKLSAGQQESEKERKKEQTN